MEKIELYKKYRPTSFDDVIGNKTTIKSLKKQIENGTHVFLFTGSAGCGKTTLARIVAKEVGATDLAIREINSAENRGIDTAREVMEEMKLSPLDGSSLVWIFDECHQWSKDAQNAFLKALEDTPDYVYFILCTTDPQKLIAPLKTRCSTIAVKSLNNDDMMTLLTSVLEKENKKINEEILEKIVQLSNGCCREALQILNKIIYLDDEKEQMEVVRGGSSEEMADVIELCRTLMSSNVSWSDISNKLKNIDLGNAETVRMCVMGYANAILMKGKRNRQAECIIQAFGNKSTYENGKFQITIACLDYLDLLK